MSLSVRQNSLKVVISRYFIGLAATLSLLYSALTFFNLYIIEDEYFQLRLKEEASYFNQELARNGQWPEPRTSYIKLYESINDFPEDIRSIMLEEPKRIEVSGDGNRYFHIYRMDSNGPYLLAEVGSQLIIRANRESILWFLGFWTFLLTVVATVIGYRLSNKSVKPLMELANEIEKIAPDKLPAELNNDYPTNEIGQLASTIEYLMQQIRDFIQREQHFTRDASHELRTPIAIVKTSLELLEKKADSMPESNRELLLQIKSASNQMEQTINTLLALARKEHTVAKEPIFILPIVEKVVVQQSYLLQGKSVYVEVIVPANAEMTIQKDDLYILLSNLISNAFQYTQTGVVTIRFNENTLSVTDTGTGLEPNIKESATEPMVKGSDSKGFGIGLSLVSRLCEHQGLKLQIHSLNSGTKVSISV